MKEKSFDATYESGAVVIPDSFGISKGLQDWIGLHHLIFQRGLALPGLPGGADASKVPDDLLGILRLSSSGFSTAVVYITK